MGILAFFVAVAAVGLAIFVFLIIGFWPVKPIAWAPTSFCFIIMVALIAIDIRITAYGDDKPFDWMLFAIFMSIAFAMPFLAIGIYLLASGSSYVSLGLALLITGIVLICLGGGTIGAALVYRHRKKALNQ